MPNDFLRDSIVGVAFDETQSIGSTLTEVESMTGELSTSLDLNGYIQTDIDYEEMSLTGSVFDDNSEENNLSGEIDDVSSLNGDIDPSELELFGDIDKPQVTNDYNDLVNLPSIDGVTLLGDLTSEEIGLQKKMSEIGTADIIKIWNNIMNE